MILSAPSRSVPVPHSIRVTLQQRKVVAKNRPRRVRRKKVRAAARRRKRSRRKKSLTNKLNSTILTRAQMRAAEAAAFTRGISADKLMEQAGKRIAQSVASFFPAPGKCIVFAGKGHNAGDAFVAAEWLGRAGWEIEMRPIYPEKELSDLTQKKLRSCRAVADTNRPGQLRSRRIIILDGLLG